MRIKIIAALLTVIWLAGCTSTAEPEKATTVPSKLTNKVESAASLTDSELAELAEKTNFSPEQLKKTNFTPEQLKVALKELGYICTTYKPTSSRIRKKICSTQKQREIRKIATQNEISERMGR